MRKLIYTLTALGVLAPAAASAQVTGQATATTTATATATSAGKVAGSATANARTEATTSAVMKSGSSTTADAAAQARINAAIEHASSRGVPESTLENKVAEGRAKGVAWTKIAAAVEHRAEVLANVQSAMEARGEAFTAGELNAAGDAHEKGVSIESITELSAQAGNDRSVALTILSNLVASGRTPEHALLRVEAALNGGADALVSLGSSAAASARAASPSVRINGSSTTEAGAKSTSGQGGASVTGRATSALGVRIGG